MARRREREQDLLSLAELKELQRQLAQLSRQAIEDFYRRVHNRCSFQPYSLPSPRSIQELVQVQARKLLRKWRK
jgi:hypothetical protein